MHHMPFIISLIGFTRALAAALVGALVVFLTAGCNFTGDDASDRPSGSAAIVISALSAADVAAATVSITASDISAPITASLSSSNGWQATIDGIPAGTGRTFTLSATDASGVEQYHGATNAVTITADQVQSVAIVAQQDSPAAGFTDAVPVIDLAQASTNTVAPGAVVNLSVTAHDPIPGNTLFYAWAASNGTFATATAPFNHLDRAHRARHLPNHRFRARFQTRGHNCNPTNYCSHASPAGSHSALCDVVTR